MNYGPEDDSVCQCVTGVHFGDNGRDRVHGIMFFGIQYFELIFAVFVKNTKQLRLSDSDPE